MCTLFLGKFVCKVSFLYCPPNVKFSQQKLLNAGTGPYYIDQQFSKCLKIKKITKLIFKMLLLSFIVTIIEISDRQIYTYTHAYIHLIHLSTVLSANCFFFITYSSYSCTFDVKQFSSCFLHYLPSISNNTHIVLTWFSIQSFRLGNSRTQNRAFCFRVGLCPISTDIPC